MTVPRETSVPARLTPAQAELLLAMQRGERVARIFPAGRGSYVSRQGRGESFTKLAEALEKKGLIRLSDEIGVRSRDYVLTDAGREWRAP